MTVRLTTRDFITKATSQHGDKYDYSLVDYVNSQTKVKIICADHGQFEQNPKHHSRGRGCYKCCGGVNLGAETFIKRATEKHGGRYDYSLVDYVTNKTKVKIICHQHGVFEQIPNSHLNGNGCPECGGSAKLNSKTFIKKATEKHGNRYDYSLVEYVNIKTKVKIICAGHGVFEQIPNDHLQGVGCPACGGRPKIDNEVFIKNATSEHGDKFDYSLVEYVTNKTKVKIICPEHGVFEQTPSSHLVGQGCPGCGGVAKLDNDTFIAKATSEHCGKYDYSLVEYVTNKTKVKIICSEHGVFLQSPNSHLRGAGCPDCGGRAKLDNDSFIKNARQKHGDCYDYSLVEYVTNKTKVKIICLEHGEFLQIPAKHLQGQGCPGCAQNGYDPSKPGRLYYVMFDFGHTILYKIGITNTTVQKRFAAEKVKPIVLWESTFSDGRIAQKVEADKKREYSEYIYSGTPLLKSGNTECFTVDIMSFGNTTRVPLAV
jgi:hypothetical protein